ncbi:uncharacterized protein LOC110463934 [Mizuhopecten yessoensis]|uniref:Uncharacterized protein n=1 Tax=Mizuhopecten yessoensis TaxID=6573 RepID=A0A210PV41_MIZYE|nr:uncharacterized protein LOC110463934 [Mizuhopecten yessoensis]OWF40361.1 hypothetical protein KP79_PYT05510 [Mizuhopecten yessoensis]
MSQSSSRNMAISGNESCYGDVCRADSFCDHPSRFCFKCAQWLHTCFTEKHKPRCTRVCKEMMGDVITQSPGTTMVAPAVELSIEPDFTSLYVLAAVVPLFFAFLIILICFYRKIGPNKPTMVIRKNICRILNVFNRRHNDQTFVKQKDRLTYHKNPRAKNNSQADASLFADRLSVTSLLSGQESRSFPSLCQSTEIPPIRNEPPANPRTPRTLPESTTQGHTDYYQISKPIKEVGDEGLSIHVDGHVLKPREIQPRQNGTVSST